MKTYKILVVDDEAPIRDMLSFTLTREGFEVLHAANGQEARRVVVDDKPDLILMDWMMPGASGIDVVRNLKRDEHQSTIPVIMLTARGQEDDKLVGFASGIDDYLVKPFSNAELLARINAVLRRAYPDGGAVELKAGAITIDLQSCRVIAADNELALGPTEFRLLRFFMENRDRVYSRAQLLDHVWGQGSFVEERTVDVHIRRLRKALEPSGTEVMIQTVRGMGYRFSVLE